VSPRYQPERPAAPRLPAVAHCPSPGFPESEPDVRPWVPGIQGARQSTQVDSRATTVDLSSRGSVEMAVGMAVASLLFTLVVVTPMVLLSLAQVVLAE
jgi:hypothetical protein